MSTTQKHRAKLSLSQMFSTPEKFFPLLALICYLPFIFLGYGTDMDIPFVLRAGKKLMYEGVYVPCRPPGLLVHEIPTALLAYFGGSVLSNLATVLFSLLGVYSFIRICQTTAIPHYGILAVCLIFHPLYWSLSTSSTDHVWLVSLQLAGYYSFLQEKYHRAGTIFALSIGTRIAGILMPVAVVLSSLISRKVPKRDMVVFSVIAFGLGGLCYVPPLIYALRTPGFFYLIHWPWGLGDYAARFVYKNIYFYGVLASVVLMVISTRVISTIVRRIRSRRNFVVLCAVTVIIAYEGLFFKLPIKLAYLLPTLPFLLILLGMALREHKALLLLFTASVLSYNLLSVNIAKPDVPHDAKTATIGLWLEQGVLIREVQMRLEEVTTCGDKIPRDYFWQDSVSP